MTESYLEAWVQHRDQNPHLGGGYYVQKIRAASRPVPDEVSRSVRRGLTHVPASEPVACSDVWSAKDLWERVLDELWPDIDAATCNYQHPDQVGRRPTPLYALTPKALQFLMPTQFSSWQEYAHARDYQRPRLERLFLAMERVMAVREFLLSSARRRLGWSVAWWDEEVSLPYWPVGRVRKAEDELAPQAPLMAGVFLEGIKGGTHAGRWLPLAFEFDQGRFPVAATRERWNDLTMAQDDSRFFHPEECPFPILILVAKDHSRLQEYLETLCDAAEHARGGRQPLLQAFRTTCAHLTQFRRTRKRASGGRLWKAIGECFSKASRGHLEH